jgi:hypothetical protein
MAIVHLKGLQAVKKQRTEHRLVVQVRKYRGGLYRFAHSMSAKKYAQYMNQKRAADREAQRARFERNREVEDQINSTRITRSVARSIQRHVAPISRNAVAYGTRAAAQSSRRDHTNGRDVQLNMWLRSRNNANYNDPITMENARKLVYESLREKLERRWGERKQRGHPGASRNFIEAVHFHDNLAVNYVDLS